MASIVVRGVDSMGSFNDLECRIYRSGFSFLAHRIVYVF